MARTCAGRSVSCPPHQRAACLKERNVCMVDNEPSHARVADLAQQSIAQVFSTIVWPECVPTTSRLQGLIFHQLMETDFMKSSGLVWVVRSPPDPESVNTLEHVRPQKSAAQWHWSAWELSGE